MNGESDASDDECLPGADDLHDPDLGNLLSETRILLPGTQVLLAFLVTLPFYARFDALRSDQRAIYSCTFFGMLTTLLLFTFPAAYHRVARPVHHKHRFKTLATHSLVAGLVTFSVSIVLVTHLVMSIAFPALAVPASIVIGLAIVVCWWVAPLVRVHDRVR